jgi:predicted O-linked N-acetylglucosamine transferase (SPINDLY family)
VILYHESGTDSTNYFMPFFRLAPAQCISYAYGYTTGIPEMDYFVSSDLIEPENGDSHYRERLIRLPSLGFYFNRPQPPARLKDRDYFGFSASDHIYACPQNLFKIHPDLYAPLGEILRRDPAGSLVLIESLNPA